MIQGRVCHSLKEIEAYFNEVKINRQTMPHWIDGVVVKINDVAAQRKLGISDDRPKGQISFKFPPEKASTILRKVTLTVGHTGAIIPTAEFDSVRLGGTNVSNALLCNWDKIKALDVAIGDTIQVMKAGEIIPYVEKVIKRPDNRKSIPEPKTCPVCDGPAARRKNLDGDGAVTECTNPECDAKVTGKIKRWIRSLDIQGIGGEVLEALTTEDCDGKGNPFVRTVADLYRLKAWQVVLNDMKVNGRRFGEKRAQAVIDEVEKKKTLTIDQFLGSLGIKYLGKRRVQLIREACHLVNGDTMDHLESWFVDGHGRSKLVCNAKCLGIPGIAEDIQAGVDANRPLIEELLRLGIVLTVPSAPKACTEGKLTGSEFCLTGEMSRSRKEIEAEITALGGFAVDTVKAGVILVSAEIPSASSKYKKAQKLGCTILSESQLIERMKR